MPFSSLPLPDKCRVHFATDQILAVPMEPSENGPARSHPLVLLWSESQSCLTLCDPMDYTVHGILQARILQWVAIPFFRETSQSRSWTQVSCTAGRLTSEPRGKLVLPWDCTNSLVASVPRLVWLRWRFCTFLVLCVCMRHWMRLVTMRLYI